MQLAAYNNNNFALGHTAMAINEGLPLYLVDRLEQRYDLATMTVGILGMAFKGGRTTPGPACPTSSSGSWPSRPAGCCAPTLRHHGSRICCRSTRSSPRPTCSSSPPPTPSTGDLATDKPVADIWNISGKGVRI